MMSDILRNYTDLTRYKTLQERFEYLRLNGVVGEELFGYDRYLNQQFYHGKEWLDVREKVIIRDQGLDLGVPGWPIVGNIYVHHMNPVAARQLREKDPILLDPEYLISCSYNMHQAITWGIPELVAKPITIRRPGDTCPWKQVGNLSERSDLRER